MGFCNLCQNTTFATRYLNLMPRTPGIRGVDFSFLEAPTLDVQFSPLGANSAGFAVTNLPGVLSILQVTHTSLWCAKPN